MHWQCTDTVGSAVRYWPLANAILEDVWAKYDYPMLQWMPSISFYCRGQHTEDRGDAMKSVDCLVETVLKSGCLSCLGSIVNNVTRNFTLIGDCFL